MGLFGEHRNVTSGLSRRMRSTADSDVEAEVRSAFALDHCRAGEPGDVPVQLVGRLERGHPSSGAGVGQQQGLQHLVGAVGCEHLVGTHMVRVGDRGAQRRSTAVGVAMPFDPRQLGSERVAPRRGWRCGRLVGVEPHPHVDLGRVIALESSQVVAYGHRMHSRPRYRPPRQRVSLDFMSWRARLE